MVGNSVMKSVWIVDDDQSIRFVLEKALEKQGIATRSFTAIQDVIGVLDGLSESGLPQVLISDIRMSGGSGIDLLTIFKQRYPKIPVIIMTAYSDLDSAVSSFQSGAFDHIAKPFDLNALLELIHRAMDENAKVKQVHLLPQASIYHDSDMIGQAPAMQDVFRAIGRLSQSHVTVLITGESGTGKELVAHALHKHSPRNKGPFIAINTAAIPKDLLESELFGHERGAFTGAQNLHKGRFEQADGGTLFLDEIGDMPLELQTRLLRVLSDGHFYRVGGYTSIKSNVRVIAATHQDLDARVRKGLFREDLFHRLNVIRLRLPALRERKEDIPALIQHFLNESVQKLGGELKKISTEALHVLCQFTYPGNVRQLENICHWLTVMAPAQIIQIKDLPQEVLAEVIEANTPPLIIQGKAGFGSRVQMNDNMSLSQGFEPVVNNMPVDVNGVSWEQLLIEEALQTLKAGQEDVWGLILNRVERSLIRAALQFTHGRRIEAALKLGIGRNTITRKMKELGLDY